jgi:hypothetical protein
MKNKFLNQIIPLILAIVTFGILTTFFYFTINILNIFPGQKISLQVAVVDILVGLTIYLKTSIDFAIFMAGLMHKYPGFKNRIAIEIGTAVGNTAGTILVMVIWYFFKGVEVLLAAMILLAALVLFKLAQTSLEHLFHDSTDDHQNPVPKWVLDVAHKLDNILTPINKFLAPVVDKIIPTMDIKSDGKTGFMSLLGLAFVVPFILGLDGFAGYIPLFNVVNILGFGIGVFGGHAILNVLLFLNPKITVKVVKNPIIALLGSIVFVGLAIWGLYEAVEVFHVTELIVGLFHK